MEAEKKTKHDYVGGGGSLIEILIMCVTSAASHYEGEAARKKVEFESAQFQFVSVGA